jgi:probable addiction module antidote protein
MFCTRQKTRLLAGFLLSKHLCGTTAPDTASISKNEAAQSSYCCAGAIKAHKQKISRPQSGWQPNGVNEMTEKLTTYDPAEDLATDEAMASFMAEAFETGDASYIAHALGVVARAKGMAQIAGQTGLSREQLYRSFSGNGNPTLKTTLAIMKALGLDLTAKPHA